MSVSEVFMYEDQDFSTIINRMLDRIPDNFDKREGSIIYDALAPTAFELANLYIQFDDVLKQAFPISSDRTYLLRYASTFGLYPYDATQAIVKIKVTMKDNSVLDIGTRFNKESVNYTITEQLTDDTYLAVCEETGTIGNQYFGQVLPIDFVRNLQRAEIIEIALPAEDEEDTEAFRQRFFDNFRNTAFGGNEADYLKFVNAIQGVGGCKIVRCPRGAGTVDVVIVDSQFKKPTQETIDYVQNQLQPKVDSYPELHTCGLGIAPIGHEVDVLGVEEKEINLVLKPTLKEGYNWENLTGLVRDKVNDYFKELTKSWADNQNLLIQIIEIMERILDIDGIVDISITDFFINGNTKNFLLEPFEIPILGEITTLEPETLSVKKSVSIPAQCFCPDCQLDYNCSVCERMKKVTNG